MTPTQNPHDMIRRDPQRWMTPKQAAAWGATSAKTVLRWVKEGKINAVIQGDGTHPRYKIDRHSLDAFYESKLIRPPKKR